MIDKKINYFDLKQICDSGQCFRMEEIMEKGGEAVYRVTAGEKYLEISQKGRDCTFFCGEEEFEGFWKSYFDLEEDYGTYIEQISEKDGYLRQAARFGEGIRILRQDLWEMTVTFLISQQNNIKRIRRCIEKLCREYGRPLLNEAGNIYYAFPRPEVLAGLGEDELKGCNLGYRSKYVVRTAQSIMNGEVDLQAVKKMDYPSAKAELLKLYGVGEKVADCICLFALHHKEAFPVDTHISQALKNHYADGFPMHRYKNCLGMMQQYIFYYELMGKELS